MVKRKRSGLVGEAARRQRVQLIWVAGRVRDARRRRRLTQQQLADRAGVSRSVISAIERGLGASHTLDAWQRIAAALDTPLRIDLGRDPLAGPADAGHLAVQELVLRLGLRAGFRGSFELPTRPADPSRSADVGLRDDGRRLLVLVECWNTIDDVGAAARSTSRKLAEAERLAVALGGERPHRVGGLWIVRASRVNRGLVRRYPQVFAARFPGSSVGWARVLIHGEQPPAEPGLVWCDTNATRLFAWRRQS
jgi:transcriptional regulator with XRE-family HTH domain